MAPKTSPWKTILSIGLITLIVYTLVFSWVEKRRRVKGPWEITFTHAESFPALLINHPKLGLTNISIVFTEANSPTNLTQLIKFPHGQEAPFDLPYGKCIFLDTLFLPGTVVCEMFGHEIQVLPRTITIDQVEYAWRSGEKILLTNRPSATLPPH